MVTIIGALIHTSSFFVLYSYDNTFTQTLPGYVYFYCIFTAFAAQTLDAIDGKHARATKRSSCLGQLVDHGCDAFVNSFSLFAAIQGYKFSGSFMGILMQLCVHWSFYIQTWEEHHTGILSTHVNNVGVTEIQFIGMIILIFPALDTNITEGMSVLGFSVLEFFVLLNIGWYFNKKLNHGDFLHCFKSNETTI